MRIGGEGEEQMRCLLADATQKKKDEFGGVE